MMMRTQAEQVTTFRTQNKEVKLFGHEICCAVLLRFKIQQHAEVESD
jgi:hypothetical protein